MQKTYKATYLYIIKAVMLFMAMITAFLAFNFGLMLLNLSPWVFYAVNIVLSLFVLLFLFMQLTAKAPMLTFDNDGFKYKRKNFSFSEIKQFKKASGGSEPELVLQDGTEVPLELSWFLKKDRKEIEALLEEKING